MTVQPQPRPEGTPSAEPFIVVEQVHKFYGDQRVLRGVDLTVDRQQVVCVVGPSGSGKSTLLRCINRLEKITAGRITVDGDVVGYRDVAGVLHELTPKEVARQRQRTGMVFQGFNLFSHMTALENVMEAQVQVKRRDRREAKEIGLANLRRVGLEDKCNAYPMALSGGQQQRVAIARALAMEPKVMLFDEPTSALDPELVGEVLDVIRALAVSGMTMIVVTHEMHFAREVADQLVVMADGRIIEQGVPSEVMSNPRQDRTRQFFAASTRA
jgi:polar amino acid transport system ATP-binding protein